MKKVSTHQTYMHLVKDPQTINWNINKYQQGEIINSIITVDSTLSKLLITHICHCVRNPSPNH